MAFHKNKSKSTNTFRFKSFAERVNEIDLRRLALYHIGHENEELSENNETFFHQTVKKWTVLNLSSEYSQFSRKVIKIVTLPQLLHRKEFVLDLLLENLGCATNLSLQPLLELLYVLARDIREEFYPYLQRVLDRLICLLNTQDAEQLEWTLVCLAYLFKTLKPYLKRNIGVIFHSILPLLDERRYQEHVTNFAVECFSFIARDVRDYGKFLEFIISTVAREEVESIHGCGRLLFEIMRGVKGHFHSTAGEFLQFVFEALVEENIGFQQPQLDLLSDIVNHAIHQLLKFIVPSEMTLFWSKLCMVLGNTKNCNRQENLMKVFLQVVQYKEGRYLMEMDIIVSTLIKVTDNALSEKSSEDLLRLITLTISGILLSGSTQVTQLDTSRLLRKSLSIKHRTVYDNFVLNMTSHAQFEIFILPSLVQYFESYFDQQSIELLAGVIKKKAPLKFSALEMNQWQSMDIKVNKLETIVRVETALMNIEPRGEMFEQQLLLLILAPHLKGLQHQKLEKSLENLLSLAIGEVLQSDYSEKMLSTIVLLVEVYYQLKLPLSEKQINCVWEVILKNLHCRKILGCFNQLLHTNPEAFKGGQNARQNLVSILQHHDHNMRLLAAHSLTMLYKEQELKTPYHIFYQIELVEPTIHNYREQLLLMQKLETQGELFKSFADETCKEDCIRFCFGILHQNFKLLWDPVLKLLEDYAKEIDIKIFWPIYETKLNTTVEQIVYQQAPNRAEESETSGAWLSNTISELFPISQEEMLTQQQVINYRMLLWQQLPQFGNIFQLKNRDLVAMFLKFVETEYKYHLENKENSWDLRINLNSMQDPEEQVEGNNAADEISEIKSKRPRVSKSDSSNIKLILQTLQCKLAVFAAQPNPRSLFKEPELWQFYNQLLTLANSQLQKSALNCIMAYKYKQLMPYKDMLYNLIDEKNFKGELLNFKVDLVAEDHREKLMHIVLRLLYGKMITKGSQKGMSPQQRKSIILRFLAQCSSAEIDWFLQMAFGLYSKYMHTSVDIGQIPHMVECDFTITAVWSPKKLQSAVNLLELIRKEFGGIMQQDFHFYMLKLLVFVGSVCNIVLNMDSSLLQDKMHVVYRNLRQNALQSFVNFFEHIEEFEWTEKLITCLTEVFVYPSLANLHLDSIHSPTALLKLLLLWGEQPKHFKYLNQTKPGHHTPIFHNLVLLLLNDKSKSLVRKPIMGLIERVLVISENDTEYSRQGLDLITPYIPELLQRLKMNFSSTASKQTFDKCDLNILSMLTKHVRDANTCDSLLQLLLPILISKTQTQSSAEVVCQIITTLSNLITRLEQPESYLRKIAPLFEQVQEVTARKQLCDLVADIAKIKYKQDSNSQVSQELKFTARIVLLLNAWDKRWVEQPDYEKRLEAFRELKQKMDSNPGLNMDVGLIVIFNCFYFLRYDKDLGLRDNASEHLRLLVPHLTKKLSDDKKQVDYLVGDIFINLIRRIIRDTNDNVRNEGIGLLGEMVRECPGSHEILHDLHSLGDKQDPEVDFFENLTHLQLHRHGRALLKFNSHANSLNVPPCARTLTQFVLPLASRYLLQEQYSGKHTIIDAAIETVGVVCNLLPWQYYHSILRYYLMKMRTCHEHQKQCVRIVVRILDAFHFDLSLAQSDADTIETLKKTIKRKVVDLENDVPEKEIEGVTTDKLDEGKDGENDGNAQTVASDEYNIETELDEQDNAGLGDENETLNTKVLNENVLCMNAAQVLSASAAKRVLTAITTILIPTLNRSITEKSSYDNKHKVNRKRLSVEREEEEILRVPISLALVKLMQKLPKDLMDTSLPGVFMKVCTFLRSPLKSVRMLTRDILKKIMLCLGSSYLPMLVDHLQNLLTRGFQVHVLAVTVHGILDALRFTLKPGDIEQCLHNLLEVALNDIFGEISAEKEIDKLTAHTPEAKPSAKSYLVLHTIARNIQETCLLDLLIPFKHHLARSKSRAVTLKIQECFAKIVNGLVENTGISRESLLIFIYGTMSESITDLLPGTERRLLTEQEKEKMRRARPDCFIIQPAPRVRSGALNKQVKSNAQANAHILIEFGLEMLHIVLKRKKLRDVDYPPFLNPILPLLRDALKSTHIRVTAFALKCFATIWIEEYELKAMEDKEYIQAVVERIFEILKNFSTFGALRQEDNFQLMKSAFKAVVALLRKCSYYNLTDNQIDELVLYIEQDLHQGENQSMTFSLLKAMLNRKVESKAIHDIMNKIGEMSIVSQSDYVRDECRNMITTYVMEYPRHKRVDNILKFYTVQLCYSLSAGRMSAIEFISAIIKKFPLSILSKKSEFLYLSLGTRMVNDEDPECRKAVASCIEILIARLEKADRDHLFDFTLLFFSKDKPSVREMGALLCSRFVNAEKQGFAARLKLLLPILVEGLNQQNSQKLGRYVRAPNTIPTEEENYNGHSKKKKKKTKKFGLRAEYTALENEVDGSLLDPQTQEVELERKQRAFDHEIIQLQYCILNIFQYCYTELLKNVEMINILDELCYESQRLLGHEHNWVRCNAAKIISHILSGYDFNLVGRKLTKQCSEMDENNATKLNYIYFNPGYDIKSLVLDLCAQVIPGETSQPMVAEITKIYLYIASMLRDVPLSVKKDRANENLVNEKSYEPPLIKTNLNWLLKIIRFLINKEVAKAPHCTTVRVALFTLLEGFITLLTVEQLESLAPSILPALVREMSEDDQSIDADLRQLALRVGSRLRKRIGSDVYDKIRTGAQMKLMIRRAERKKVIAQEKIHNPVRAAKRKLATQERKKTAKKLKASVMRGKTADIKQKLKKRKRKAEEDFF